MRWFGARAALLALGLATTPLNPAAAESITMLVGFPPGQGNDLATGVDTGGIAGQRLSAEPTFDQAAAFYARHLPRFLPGATTLVVKSMPGAAGLLAERALLDAAQGATETIAMLGPASALPSNGERRDPRRVPVWIGARQHDDDVCAVRRESPLHTIADAQRQSVFMASLSPGSRSWLNVQALNLWAGTRFKIVSGYPTGFEVSRAIETGEVDGWCGWSIQGLRMRQPALLRDGDVRLLLQFTAQDMPILQIPRAEDLTASNDQREAMRALSLQTMFGAFALAAAPQMPAARLGVWRAAFAAAMRDRQALEEAASLGIALEPIEGEVLQAAADRLRGMPASVLATLLPLLGKR